MRSFRNITQDGGRGVRKCEAEISVTVLRFKTKHPMPSVLLSLMS